jgi:hypothetical protein
MSDWFAIPNLDLLMSAGVLAPNLPSGGAQGLSGRRYPQPRPRGMAPWNPQKKTLEVLAQVDAVLVEYEQYLPLATYPSHRFMQAMHAHSMAELSIGSIRRNNDTQSPSLPSGGRADDASGT